MSLKRTIQIGPFSWFFTNVNKEMNLPGHSHYAEITLIFLTTGTRGFPSFADTHKIIQDKLIDFGSTVFRDCTNENILERLWNVFVGFPWDEFDLISRYGGSYFLHAMELAVRGVPDRIGHADSFTRYRIDQ